MKGFASPVIVQFIFTVNRYAYLLDRLSFKPMVKLFVSFIEIYKLADYEVYILYLGRDIYKYINTQFVGQNLYQQVTEFQNRPKFS